MKRSFHPALAMGDQDFRDELYKTISAPIALAAGLTKSIELPQSTIEISLEDNP